MAKTILLADDSVTIQKVVELTFMEQDCEVVAVGDGDSAVKKLAELQPDLLIADVHMPGIDGYELCRRTKESLPGVPVLLLVGTFEPFDEARAQAVNADAHLKKPFDSQDLLQQVESLLARAPGSGAAEAGAEAGGGGSEEFFALPSEDAPSPEVQHSEASQPSDEPSFEMPSFEPIEEAPELDLSAEESQQPAEPPTFEAAPSEPPPAAVSGESLEPPKLQVPPSAAPPAEEAAPVPPESPPAPRPEPAAPAAAEAPAAPAAAPPPAEAEGNGHHQLSDEDVDRIARRVAQLVGETALREVAWEVVPDLAEVIIKERIRELENQVE